MDQTFCIYCQVNYGTPRGLVNHIKRKHRNTHAYVNLVPEDEQT